MQRIRPKSLHAVTGKPTSEWSEEEQAVLGCRGKKSGRKDRARVGRERTRLCSMAVPLAQLPASASNQRDRGRLAPLIPNRSEKCRAAQATELRTQAS